MSPNVGMEDLSEAYERKRLTRHRIFTHYATVLSTQSMTLKRIVKLKIKLEIDEP